MSDPKFIKLSDTAAIRVSNFQDKNGNRFIGLSKMWRRREETGKSSWKPGRQYVTIPEEFFVSIRKAASAMFDTIETAEVWAPDDKPVKDDGEDKAPKKIRRSEESEPSKKVKSKDVEAPKKKKKRKSEDA